LLQIASFLAALESAQQAMASLPHLSDCFAGVFRGPTKKAMPLGIAFVMMKLPDSLGFLGNLAGFPSSTVAATASGTGHR